MLFSIHFFGKQRKICSDLCHPTPLKKEPREVILFLDVKSFKDFPNNFPVSTHILSQGMAKGKRLLNLKIASTYHYKGKARNTEPRERKGRPL